MLIVEGGAFSKPVDLTTADEIVLGGNRVVKVHAVRMLADMHATRWAVVKFGDHMAYFVGGETLHKDLEAAGCTLDCDIYISPRRVT